MIVIDASALLETLLRSEVGLEISDSLLDNEMHAPHLIDLEVAQALRHIVLHGELTAAQGHEALVAFAAMPIMRHPHTPLMLEIWALRHNLTSYDAAYLALARALGAPLITQDAALRKMAARGRTN
jgi:predicted nucleic acid-binding protein